MTSAARTKWVGSGPLSTPEIEFEEKLAEDDDDDVGDDDDDDNENVMGDFCHKNKMGG